MRITFAAVPRLFDWHSGFKTKTYAAQPSPPVVWHLVPQRDAIQWCDGVLLTWASTASHSEKPAANKPNVVGFLAGRLGRDS